MHTSTTLNAYLAFPHVQQVFRLERTTTVVKTGEIRHEIVVGVTSCDSNRATPADLLAAVRQHWTIENQVHWTRDVTWKEDASHVRTGSAPRMLASFRNMVLSWLDLKKKKGIASQLRILGWDRDAALAVVTEAV